MQKQLILAGIEPAALCVASLQVNACKANVITTTPQDLLMIGCVSRSIHIVGAASTAAPHRWGVRPLFLLVKVYLALVADYDILIERGRLLVMGCVVW